MKRMYQRLTLQQRAQVIMFRYGSLHDFRNIRARYCDIGRRLGIRANTVEAVVYAFHKRGHQL